MSEQIHETSVHWGDWHVFAYCKICHWEGTRSNHHGSGNWQHRQGEEHTAEMRRRRLRARIAAFFTRRKPVSHLVHRESGRTLQCCDKLPLDVNGLDYFIYDEQDVTCSRPDTEGGGEG